MSNCIHKIVYKKWIPEKLNSGDTYKVSSWTVPVLVRGDNQVDAVTDLREWCREQGFEIEIQEITYLGEIMEVKKV